MANDIIGEHSGTIIIESDPGQYTVVTISIPNGAHREQITEEEWSGVA